jgi:hypothetical protein
MADGHDAQAVVATQSPTLMRRVEPAQVRYLRLDEQRLTTVSTVTMPEKADPTQKFVCEAPCVYGHKDWVVSRTSRLTAASVRTHGAEVTSCCTRSAGADR